MSHNYLWAILLSTVVSCQHRSSNRNFCGFAVVCCLYMPLVGFAIVEWPTQLGYFYRTRVRSLPTLGSDCCLVNLIDVILAVETCWCCCFCWCWHWWRECWLWVGNSWQQLLCQEHTTLRSVVPLAMFFITASLVIILININSKTAFL